MQSVFNDGINTGSKCELILLVKTDSTIGGLPCIFFTCPVNYCDVSCSLSRKDSIKLPVLSLNREKIFVFWHILLIRQKCGKLQAKSPKSDFSVKIN